MSNMKLWDSVFKTDPKHTKPGKIGGLNITSVDPQYQRMNATRVFGPYGIGWGIIPESENIIYRKYDNGDELACYTATMFYLYEGNRGEFPINANIKTAFITKSGQGYLKVDDEFLKKLQTNALTKGLSFIGFNADVFMGKFDDNKYVAEVKEEFAADDYQKSIEPFAKTINAIKDGIATNDLSSASEAWYELTDDEKKLLWKATSKGGPFSTEERKVMQTTEFREANGGNNNDQ